MIGPVETNHRVQLDERPFPGPSGSLYLRSVLPSNNLPHLARLGLIHGYGDHSGRYARFMRWMAERGIACHAVDLRGQGKAAGRRGFVRRWGDYLDDVAAFVALDALRGNGPLFLLGHSHGALVLAAGVLRGLGADGSVAGCVLSSPFFRNRMEVPRHKLIFGRVMEPVLPWLRVRTGVRPEWMSSDAEMIAENRVDPLVTPFATPRWFFGQRKAQRWVMESAAGFRLPLLVLVGGADPLADPAGGREFYERAGSKDKTLITYPGHLHELLRETQRERVFADVLGWLRR